MTLTRVRSIHTSSFLLEPQVVKVPSMGDSITEGTIVDWEKKVGDAVTEGDVVALIETDKVTIDIKAEMDGVITALYGGV
jgi:2-oxoglutarate dehydrogenase E2 component (dihydrolipoamide succinyltransferase)